MRLDDASYPHPVVGLHGDVEGELIYESDVHATTGDITISLSNLRITNSTIAALLHASRASFTVVVSCPATYYREGIYTSEREYSISIPADRLLGRVEVNVSVC